MRELRRMDKPMRRVMIGGGGNIGLPAGARAREATTRSRSSSTASADAERLAARARRALVLRGDVTDEELLETENIGEMDVYCAVTNDDENNIMSLAARQAHGRAQGDRADQPHAPT